MARLTRLSLVGQPHYVILTGLKGLSLVQSAENLSAMFDIFSTLVPDSQVDVSGYVILPDQIHLMLTPKKDAEDLSRFVQNFSRLYCRYYNAAFHRSGTIWQGRFASSVVEGSERIMNTLIFMEMMPQTVRYAEPQLYPWSSYFHHSGLRNDFFMMPVKEYWSLGNTPFERQKNYKTRFEQGYSKALTQDLIQKVKRGWPQADKDFLESMKISQDRMAPLRGRGRPRKTD